MDEVVSAIERLIKAEIWLSKVSYDDVLQQFDAENELNSARKELSKALKNSQYGEFVGNCSPSTAPTKATS